MKVRRPIGTLPGYTRPACRGDVCDECDLPATAEIQGETDSFAAEFHTLCPIHFAQMKNRIAASRELETICDLCKKSKTHCTPWRDYDEGVNGPVYSVCVDCKHQKNEELREDLIYVHKHPRRWYDD